MARESIHEKIPFVAVLGRNRTLFHFILLCSKRYSAEPSFRMGLICAAKMYEYLISLRSVYEPRP